MKYDSLGLLVGLLGLFLLILIEFWIFCFSIVFCPDGTVIPPCSAGFWARGHIKVRLSSLTLPWRRWRSRHHLTPVLRTLGRWQSFVMFCPGVVPNIQGSSRFFMVENCSFRLGLDLSTHQYCGSCATALAIYINLCYPKLFNDASGGAWAIGAGRYPRCCSPQWIYSKSLQHSNGPAFHHYCHCGRVAWQRKMAVTSKHCT